MVGVRTSNEMMMKLFDEFDLDGDGSIDINEIRQVLRKKQKSGVGASTASPPQRVSSQNAGQQSSSSTKRASDDSGQGVGRASRRDPGVPMAGASRDRKMAQIGTKHQRNPRGNPFSTMKLALETADTMDALTPDFADNPTWRDEIAASLVRTNTTDLDQADDRPELAAVDAGANQRLERSSCQDSASSRTRPFRSSELTDAAVTIQASCRGMQTRRFLRTRDKARRWSFEKFHSRSFTTNGIGKNRVHFSVGKDEYLELVAVKGVGRIMLNATSPSGETVVLAGIVYDSSAHALNHPGQSMDSTMIRGVGKALWGAAGEFDYFLYAEPLSRGGPPASLTVCVHVLSEPLIVSVLTRCGFLSRYAGDVPCGSIVLRL